MVIESAAPRAASDPPSEQAGYGCWVRRSYLKDWTRCFLARPSRWRSRAWPSLSSARFRAARSRARTSAPTPWFTLRRLGAGVSVGAGRRHR
jgi:hypothetical protein